MSWSRFGSRSSRSRHDSWTPFAPYVSVADRRAQAAAQVNRMAKAGHAVAPVVVEGSVIAHTVWGKAWCKALESHADLANRLGRGRSYVRHGCVVDLQPSTGLVTALISGSEVYHANITFEPLPEPRWRDIVTACRGQIRSMVELLQGKLSTEVMAVVCRPGEGLFPRIGEMRMRCSCPDSAWMCKHLAAVLYGIGHRLDRQPELLFTLRGVDPSELIAAAPLAPIADDDPRSLGDADLSALFGVSLDDAGPVSQLPPSSAAGAFASLDDLPPVSLVLPPRVSPKKPAAKATGKRTTKVTVAKKPTRAQAPPVPPLRGKGGSTGESPHDESPAASSRPKAGPDNAPRPAPGSRSAGHTAPEPRSAGRPAPGSRSAGRPAPGSRSAGRPAPEPRSAGHTAPGSRSAGRPAPGSRSAGHTAPEPRSAGQPLPAPPSAGQPPPASRSAGRAAPASRSAGQPAPGPHSARRRGRDPSYDETGSAPPLAAQGGDRGGPPPSNPAPEPKKPSSKAVTEKPAAKRPAAKKPAKR